MDDCSTLPPSGDRCLAASAPRLSAQRRGQPPFEPVLLPTLAARHRNATETPQPPPPPPPRSQPQPPQSPPPTAAGRLSRPAAAASSLAKHEKLFS